MKAATKKTSATKPDYSKELMQVLWHYRHAKPSLSITVSEEDEKAFNECCDYLKIEPKISTVNRPAINKDGINKPAYSIIALTDQDGNTFAPIENNEKDYALAESARTRRRLAANAERLAENVKNNAANGDFSSSDIQELCDTVKALL
jgi:hypothetical protein